MNSIDDIAPRLTGSKEGTFRYETIRTRWPTILTRVIDHFSTGIEKFTTRYGEDAEKSVKQILSALSEIHYLMVTDKPLRLLTDNFEDVNVWNEHLSSLRLNKELVNSTWYKEPWLFVECYLYRLIFSFVFQSQVMEAHDYFFHQKIASFHTHTDQIILGVEDLNKFVALGQNEQSITSSLTSLLKICLWGNRADLSLSGGIASLFNESSKDLDARDKYILINHIPDAINYLKSIKPKVGDALSRIDIILDNSGVELAGDLTLADYLVTAGLVDKVVFHGKKIPWFVSDTTPDDFQWTIKAIAELKGSDGAVREDCQRFSRSITERLEQGIYEFKCEGFWTLPFPYTEMATRAPELYADLSESSLVILKGDLNYRKLVEDRDWTYETPMMNAVGNFLISPLLVLRTLKSETVVGLDRTVVDHVLSRYGDDYQWMTTGTYAVAHFHVSK
ncbi:unnamed protein product [Auanema sp. JU1783]|nr:unnamed protein product [Auanema sp. JU1783]